MRVRISSPAFSFTRAKRTSKKPLCLNTNPFLVFHKVSNEFLETERKWQAAWERERAFEPSADAEKEKWFFTVPYPYVSGCLHVGHGRTYVGGDVIARYKRMKGYNVLWPMAFHITGTPVLAVSAKIESGDEETLKLYESYVGEYEKDAARVKEIVASFKDPWKLVEYFSGKLVQDFQAMGFSLDFTRRFTTGDEEYNKFIDWQFRKYEKKGYLKQAGYPLLYCTVCRNAAGEDDIKDGDTQPVDLMEFIAVKFAFGDAFIVSCTLRPETVFGITNEFVNPEADYVKIRFENNEKWWVSKEAAEKLALQGRKHVVEDEKKGSFFAGKKCVDPLGKEIPIFPAEFVDADNASGFVHSVPAHAPYDFVALEQLKKSDEWGALAETVKMVSLISLEGYGEFPAKEVAEKMKIANLKEKGKLEKATNELYKVEYYNGVMKGVVPEFAGLKVTQAKDKAAEWLRRQGKADKFYETNRHASCRCGGKIIGAVMEDQWFIDYNSPGWKDASRKCLDSMLIHPKVYRKQFEDVFEWLDKRPCARRRGLGTKLPFDDEWIIESLSDSTMYMAFYTIIKKVRELGLKPKDLTEEFFDFVFLGKGEGSEAEREVRKEFEYWYPNDLRHTGVAHITNHLSFYIFAHTAIFPGEYWPKGISLNEMLISEGTKMSKSKGNVVLLNHVSEEYGADLFRVYVAGAADFGSTLDFRKKELVAAKRSLLKFDSMTREFNEAGEGRSSPLARWALSKFESNVKEAGEALEELRVRDFVQIAFYKTLNAFEHFKRRATREEAAFVGSRVAEKWVRLLAPVIPHACEELWNEFKGEGLVSLAEWPEADESLIDKEAEAGEDYVMNALDDSRCIIRRLKKKPSKLLITVASKEKLDALRKGLQAEKPEDSGLEGALADYAAKSFYELKEARFVDEFLHLQQAKEFYSRELGVEVEVEREEGARNQKAERAMPLKPALLFE